MPETTTPFITWLFGIAAPVAIIFGVIIRRRRRVPISALMLAFIAALALGAIVMASEHAMLHLLQINPTQPGTLALLAAIVLLGPLESMAAATGAIMVLRDYPAASDADASRISHIAALGTGFARATSIALFSAPAASPILLCATLTGLANLACTHPWSLRVSSLTSRRKSSPQGGFVPLWLLSASSLGLIHYLLIIQGDRRTFGIALLIVMIVSSAVVGRYIALQEKSPTSGRHTLIAKRSASIRAIGDALTHHDRPISIVRIIAGGIVAIGTLLAAELGAVGFGLLAEVDFSAVDDPTSRGIGPLGLLFVAALAAFAGSGFVLARATKHPTLIEPAASASIAIASCVAVLGVATPIALATLVIGIPFAVGLTCVGAWIGTAR